MLDPEKVWNEVAWMQRRIGKRFRLVGGAYLQSLVRPEFRRQVHDVDLFIHPAHMERVLSEWRRKYPKTEMASNIWSLYPKVFMPRLKDIDDLRRVERTYQFLKRKNKDVAEMYLDDLAAALAKDITNLDPFTLVLHLEVARDVLGMHGIGDFYRTLVERALQILKRWNPHTDYIPTLSAVWPKDTPSARGKHRT